MHLRKVMKDQAVFILWLTSFVSFEAMFEEGLSVYGIVLHCGNVSILSLHGRYPLLFSPSQPKPRKRKRKRKKGRRRRWKWWEGMPNTQNPLLSLELIILFYFLIYFLSLHLKKILDSSEHVYISKSLFYFVCLCPESGVFHLSVACHTTCLFLTAENHSVPPGTQIKSQLPGCLIGYLRQINALSHSFALWQHAHTYLISFLKVCLNLFTLPCPAFRHSLSVQSQ